MINLKPVPFAIAALFALGSQAQAGLIDDLFGKQTNPTSALAPEENVPCEAPICKGEFSEPFVEPVVYRRDAETDLDPNAEGTPSAEKCLYDPETDRQRCKPAAGTISLLPNGKFLYFNALEGTEDFDNGILVDFGQDAINDQTRVLSIPKSVSRDDPAFNPTWVRPTDVDSGANQDGYEITELIPGLTNKGTNGADGALFCADVAMMPDGQILAVGGTAYYSEPGMDGLDVGLVELEGLKNSRAYNPNTNQWTQKASMNYGRWYPSTVTLSDSKVFVASGVTKLLKPVYPNAPEQSGRNVTYTETFDPTAGDGLGEWTDNGEAAQRSLPLYPRLHLLPNGHVFYNAGGQAFNPFGQSYDQAVWNIAATYNPGSKSWSDLAYAGFPFKFSEAGLEHFTEVLNLPTAPTNAQDKLAGLLSPDTLMKSPQALESLVSTLTSTSNPELAVQQAVGGGMRGSTFSVQMPLRPNENGDYTDASFLTAGGVLPYGTVGSPGGYFAIAASRIDTVRTELADNVADASIVGYESEVVGALNETRWYGTGVLMPDDSVIVFSGGDRDGVAAPGVEFPRKTAERFDPRTKTWSQMAVANQPRTYHNTALLMPDGRVLVGGHAPISTLYINNIDLSMFGLSPNDGRDPSFEIYTPPYVLNPNRPVLEAILNPQGSDPQSGKAFMHQFQPGENVRLRMDEKTKMNNVDSVTLVRHTVMTHLIDGDQRTIVIPKENLSLDGNVVSFDIPDQATVIPEGAYMIFVRTKQADDSLLPSESLSVMIKHGV